MKRNHFPVILTASTFILMTGLGQADVTLKTKTTSNGFRGFGAHETTSTRMIQGKKSRDESKIKYKSRLLRMMSGKKKGGEATIARVDLGKYIHLNKKKKTYTEIPIRPLKEMMASQPKMPTGASAPKGGPTRMPDDKPTHKIKKTKYDVVKTGEKKNLNGFDVFEIKTTAMVKVEELQTKLVTTYTLDTRTWITPWNDKLKQASKEEQAFAVALMKKLGINISHFDKKAFGSDQLSMMLGIQGKDADGIINRIKSKAGLFNGYTVASDTKWFVDEDPKVKAEKEKALAQAEAEDEETDLDYSGGAKGLAGSLLGGFAKKKMKKRAIKKQKEKMKAPVLTTYYEVKAVDLSKIDKSKFEAPSNFKKEEIAQPPAR